MPKIAVNLEQIRDKLIMGLWRARGNNMLTGQDIGKIFNLSLSTVYKVIKDNKATDIDYYNIKS